MKDSKPAYQNLKPTIRDWVLVGIGLAFVVMGIVILPKNPKVGIVTLTFFGLCAGVAIRTVIRKRKESKFQGLSVHVIGGVEIRPSRLRILILSVSLVIVGAVLLIFGNEYPLVFRVLAGLICGIGIVLMVLVAFRKIPVGFIRFDYEGFTIGRKRWNVTLPWDEIALVRPGDFNGNSALYLWVKSYERIRTEPKEFHSLAVAEILSSESWVGSHFMILTENYNLHSPMVAEALERYVSEPEVREELKNRKILS
ncbi:hypothetical protein [Leptospira barantonii]|uniref:Uncharacterized protein n=1 Tax=Leptospira barantonii TaxID=2023184 RepID=A0ABX4NN07_9LEPT|nr:hypothetical protein [Leptospira barantonii]PJZ58118.1 hypothetical protein CH367_06955 [Leptospira barantonii]